MRTFDSSSQQIVLPRCIFHLLIFPDFILFCLFRDLFLYIFFACVCEAQLRHCATSWVHVIFKKSLDALKFKDRQSHIIFSLKFERSDFFKKHQWFSVYLRSLYLF